jgi:alpha-beta hydrolase superfamily lysophospholipase
MKKLFIASLLLSINAFASPAFQFMKVKSLADCELRVLIQNPPKGTPVRADFLFLIGFSDRADNHAPLFDLLTQSGLRVISFDYPGHGESECGSLNDHKIHDLIYYADQVERKTREDQMRPLFLAGWSTGALLVVRGLQKYVFLERKISGAVLIAPAVSVHKIVGDMGFVTQEVLTSHPNPPFRGAIKPNSPFKVPFFATSLLSQSIWSNIDSYPVLIPTLVFAAGQDSVVKTSGVKGWVYKNRGFGADIQALECAEGKHMLDNEFEPLGSEVRNNVLNFTMSPENFQYFSLDKCKPF